MNDVIISGLIKGSDFQDVSNDGILLQVATRIGRGNNADPDVFNVLAYGNSAEFIRQHGRSGLRMVAQGRISSEKLGTDNYHTVITLSRVLSIGESRTGTDFTQAVISGTVRCNEVKQTSRGTTLAPFNVKNVRQYKTRDGNQGEYTTYLNATAWSDTAEELQSSGRIPCEDEFAVISGILKPNSYEKDGETVNKVDVWINDITFSSVSESSSDTNDTPFTPTDTVSQGDYKDGESAPF